MNQSSHVSIIMPAYNMLSYIGESIESVQNQSHKDWELLIVDDGSTDGTVIKIQEYQAKDSRIRLIPLPVNQGVGISCNIGIKAAVGAYIAFLDADDLWMPDKLEQQLNFMRRHRVAVSYSSYEVIDHRGSSKGYYVKALERLSFNKILKGNYIGNLTGMYHASSIGKIYGAPIRKRQDWSLWIEAVKRAGRTRGIIEPLAKYRLRRPAFTESKWELLQYDFAIYRKVLEFNWLKSCWYFMCFLFEKFVVKPRQKKKLSQ